MKRIGIDARLYFQTGVGVYIRNLLHYLQLQEIRDFEFYIYVMPEDNLKISLHNKSFHKVVVPWRWHSTMEQIGFLWRLYMDNLDLVHFTYFSHPILYNRPFISTIHDVILLQMKTGKASTRSSLIYHLKHWAFTNALLHQVKKSKTIITPTNTIANQITSLYGDQYKSKIVCTHEGVNFELIEAKYTLRPKVAVDRSYLMYVGNFYPHKNIERLVDAFSMVKTSMSLVLIGPNDYFAKRLQSHIEAKNLKNRVIFIHDVSSSDLKWYYTHAQALIHPSLSEGFGLPLIEAQYFKCPVIASNIEVFNETLADKKWVFDPYSISDICKTIESFVEDGGRDTFHTAKKMENFSFLKMTNDTYAIYKNATSNTYENRDRI